VQALLVPMVEQAIALVVAVVVQALHHLEVLEVMQELVQVLLESQVVEVVVAELLNLEPQEAQVVLVEMDILKLHPLMLMWLLFHQVQHGPLRQALHQLT
jgi:hypothetical protein